MHQNNKTTQEQNNTEENPKTQNNIMKTTKTYEPNLAKKRHKQQNAAKIK